MRLKDWGLYAGIVLLVQDTGPGFGDPEKAKSWSVSKMQNSCPVQGHITRYGISFPRIQRSLAPQMSNQEPASLDLQPLTPRCTRGTLGIYALIVELDSLLPLKGVSLQFQLKAKHTAPNLGHCLPWSL